MQAWQPDECLKVSEHNGGVRLRPPIGATGLGSRLRSAQAKIERLRGLEERTWLEAVDTQRGGVVGLLGQEGELSLVLVSRYLYFAARWGSLGHVRARRLADEAFELLCQSFHDPAEGGFYWQVQLSQPGTRAANKQMYGQAFALLALATYARTTGHTYARKLAVETFEQIEHCGRDAEYLGYYESLTRGWNVQDEVSYLRWPAGLKLMNTHIHLLEAFTALYEVVPSARLRQRMIELIALVAPERRSGALGLCLPRYTRSFASPAGHRHQNINFGHLLKSSRILSAAHSSLELPTSLWLQDSFRRFDYALRYGFSRKHGAFLQEGKLGWPAHRRAKVWWIQAEALCASLELFEHSREGRHLEVFDRVLQWVCERQVDGKEGGWHHVIDGFGRPRGPKISAWKGPYHTGVAILDCAQRLALLGA